MKPKLVIFDFDGTLADTKPFMLSILDHMAEHFHIRPVDGTSLEELRGYTTRQIMKMYNVPMWKLPLMAKESQKLLYQNIATIDLFPGIDRVMRALAEKEMRLAVVTSNQLRNVLAVLGEELARLITAFECEAGFFGKAARLRRVLRTVGICPEEALCFGDETRDIEAARKAGISCAAVTWGYGDAEALGGHKPDYLLTSVEQILEIAT